MFFISPPSPREEVLFHVIIANILYYIKCSFPTRPLPPCPILTNGKRFQGWQLSILFFNWNPALKLWQQYCPLPNIVSFSKYSPEKQKPSAIRHETSCHHSVLKWIITVLVLDQTSRGSQGQYWFTSETLCCEAHSRYALRKKRVLGVHSRCLGSQWGLIPERKTKIIGNILVGDNNPHPGRIVHYVHLEIRI